MAKARTGNIIYGTMRICISIAETYAQLSNKSWLREHNVICPFVRHGVSSHAPADATFRYCPPERVQIHDSLVCTDAADRPYVDITCQMPTVSIHAYHTKSGMLLALQSMFDARDYMNDVYFVRRALYLCALLVALRKALGDRFQFAFTTVDGDARRPALTVMSVDDAAAFFVRIVPHAATELFKLHRFLPATSNLRASYYSADNINGQYVKMLLNRLVNIIFYCATAQPTPQYNASMLNELLCIEHKRRDATSSSDNDVERLLAAWLARRELLHVSSPHLYINL